MKNRFIRNKQLWTGILAVFLILAIAACVILPSFSGSRTTQEITVEQAQKIVDNAFSGIAKETANGAKIILNNTKITVTDIS